MDSVFRRAALASYGLALGFGLSAAVTHNHPLNIAGLLCAVVAVVLTRRYGLPS
jgi:hypothetical protein